MKLPMLKTGLKMAGQRIQVMQQTRNPEAEQRIRGRKWMAIRERVLKRDCGLCQECLRNGRITPLTLSTCKTDHIVRRIDEGSNDDSNLQSLCEPCHTRKTALEAKAR